MNRLIVVQARTGSTRLPGKVLLPVAGRPMLERQLQRIVAARAAFELTVATTVDPADDPIWALCSRIGIRCFRGHPTDLLDRHVQAARLHGADRVVKIPSDCPLIDPAAIEAVLAADDASYDYVSNLRPGSWPDGNDVEIMAMSALETAWREADRPFQREHTTPFIWDQPERFRCRNVRWSGGDLSRTHRFTVDYPEDYRLVASIYDHLHGDAAVPFGTDDILALLDEKPELLQANARHVGRSWERAHQTELRTLQRET